MPVEYAVMFAEPTRRATHDASGAVRTRILLGRGARTERSDDARRRFDARC